MKSKRRKGNEKLVDRVAEVSLEEGLELLKKCTTAKFNETVEVAIRLGVDPKKADQVVRGTVALPHGTGKTVRVCAVTKTKNSEAEEAGADFVGHEEILEKIKGGWTDFDVLVATPEVMPDLGKLGKILGPRGLMPNPKAGTVTPNIGPAIKEIKAGKVEFRVDKYGIVHLGVGRTSFSNEQLKENILEFFRNIVRLKPATAKGTYVKSCFITSTMGPGIRLARSTVESARTT
ncbi:50S ribosomal protein L1 [bacterium]|nr:50S ribosomal protein L1 [bacterium]MBU1920309.1 50S ribosomal protein L1 [bacterium]RQV98447.1 MAG: 50S ribosomal protein L1 [bacterium]